MLARRDGGPPPDAEGPSRDAGWSRGGLTPPSPYSRFVPRSNPKNSGIECQELTFPTKDFKVPTQPEKRERKLREFIRKRQKPIALFIDEGHDLHTKTLVGLKRLS